MNVSPNVVHSMDAHHLNEELLDARYDRRLEIDGSSFIVTWLPFWQKIIFTELNGMNAGQFKVDGWIASKQPADFILKYEVSQYIEMTKNRLKRTK